MGYLSSAVSDRALLVGALGVTAASLAAMTRVVTSDAAYFAGGVAMFVGTVVLEVVATSLMTKVIWPGFARGTMNAGEAWEKARRVDMENKGGCMCYASGG